MAAGGIGYWEKHLKLPPIFSFLTKFWTVKVAGLREKGYSNSPKQSTWAQLDSSELILEFSSQREIFQKGYLKNTHTHTHNTQNI